MCGAHPVQHERTSRRGVSELVQVEALEASYPQLRAAIASTRTAFGCRGAAALRVRLAAGSLLRREGLL